MTYDFRNKTVVTGASRGIGEAIARTLAADEAKVALIAPAWPASDKSAYVTGQVIRVDGGMIA